MRPITYYGNLFSLGTLSGSNSTSSNSVARIADGSISLDYQLTSGLTPSGDIQVTLSTAQTASALTVPSGLAVSGHRFILESEDVGGGNNATILDFTLSSTSGTFVREFSGATARKVWRLTVSGTLSGSQFTTREVTLSDKLQFPRSPAVGVPRSSVRQFSRINIPGGQPFVKRDGPKLKRTAYTFVVLSGAERDSIDTWIEGIEGGEAFYFIDDEAGEYWAEVPDPPIPFQDEAGVHNLIMTFQEIAVS